MQKKFFTWMGKEFIELSGEAKPAATATSEAQELFGRFDQELRAHGLSLDNTVRSRSVGPRSPKPRPRQQRAREDLVRQGALGKLELYRARPF